VLVTLEPAGPAPPPDVVRANRDADELREIVRLPRVARIVMDFDTAPQQAPASVEPTDAPRNGGQS
jgi:hypothetical protein